MPVNTSKKLQEQGAGFPSVAIVHHYLAHYRESVFNLLCRQASPEPVYVLFSDCKSNDAIVTINPHKASLAPANGGLHWRFIRNYSFGRHFLWQTDLIKLALGKEFSVIIYLGNMYHLSTWVSLVLARLAGKRTLLWTHGYLKEEKGIQGWLRERFYRLSDGLLLYGNRARDILIKRGFNPSSLHVVYNSLDYGKQCHVRATIDEHVISDLRRKLFSSPDLPILIFIGRLTSQKRLDMILCAAKVLGDRGISVNILFVGKGPAQEMLLRSAKEFALANRVVFYGECFREEELGPLMRMADLCISPGEVGLTCMHALVYGTPVITHNNPDHQMPEWEAIIDGMSGAFFKEGDCKDLARCIERWLQQGRSREQIRADCQKVIDNYYNPHYQAKIINETVKGSIKG